MAILRVDEIRKMRKEERGKKLTELKAELSKLMSNRAMGGSMENPARIGLIKKTIAQFYTIQREEELGIRKVEALKEEKPKMKEKKKKEAEPAEKEAKLRATRKRAKKATVDEEEKEATNTEE
jgi:large subunit ribosomal protein L29